MEASSPGFGMHTIVAEATQPGSQDLSSLSVLQIKAKLLDLLPRMKGTAEDFAVVESYVNALESKYYPPQTLDFFNLALGGTWQLLFSTNLQAGPRSNFRLKELVQKVAPTQFQGNLINVAQWDLSQSQRDEMAASTDMDGSNGGVVFDCSGTFTVSCTYKIQQGSRMMMQLEDHKIELIPGSTVPTDIPGLVALLHRAMPTELFDPNGHSMDTTYQDGDLRIVRMTGSSFEGVRDIFFRSGTLELNPIAL